MNMNIEALQTTGFAQQTATRDTETNQARQPQTKSALAPDQAHDTLQTTQSSVDQTSVDQAVKHLSDFVSLVRPEISFSTDTASGIQVVKVIDSQSQEVIRQIPSEEAIQLAQALDTLQGLFVKEKV